MAFQQAGLFESRTSCTNVEFPLELTGRRQERAEAHRSGELRPRQLPEFAKHIRGSFRAACSSGSRSPGPWPATRRCC